MATALSALGLGGMHDPYDPRYYSVDPSRYRQLQQQQQMDYDRLSAIEKLQAAASQAVVYDLPRPSTPALDKTLLLLGE